MELTDQTGYVGVVVYAITVDEGDDNHTEDYRFVMPSLPLGSYEADYLDGIEQIIKDRAAELDAFYTNPLTTVTIARSYEGTFASVAEPVTF